jgi:hypothetical protein
MVINPRASIEFVVKSILVRTEVVAEWRHMRCRGDRVTIDWSISGVWSRTDFCEAIRKMMNLSLKLFHPSSESVRVDVHVTPSTLNLLFDVTEQAFKLVKRSIDERNVVSQVRNIAFEMSHIMNVNRGVSNQPRLTNQLMVTGGAAIVPCLLQKLLCSFLHSQCDSVDMIMVIGRCG